jgi:hypothetical protein
MPFYEGGPVRDTRIGLQPPTQPWRPTETGEDASPVECSRGFTTDRHAGWELVVPLRDRVQRQNPLFDVKLTSAASAVRISHRSSISCITLGRHDPSPIGPAARLVIVGCTFLPFIECLRPTCWRGG